MDMFVRTMGCSVVRVQPHYQWKSFQQSYLEVATVCFLQDEEHQIFTCSSRFCAVTFLSRKKMFLVLPSFQGCAFQEESRAPLECIDHTDCGGTGNIHFTMKCVLSVVFHARVVHQWDMDAAKGRRRHLTLDDRLRFERNPVHCR